MEKEKETQEKENKDLQDQIKIIKEEYEKKFQELKLEYENKLKEEKENHLNAIRNIIMTGSNDEDEDIEDEESEEEKTVKRITENILKRR